MGPVFRCTRIRQSPLPVGRKIEEALAEVFAAAQAALAQELDRRTWPNSWRR